MKVLADGWTAVTVDGSLSAHFEHTVAVTSTGPWMLTALPARGRLGRRRRASGRAGLRRGMSGDGRPTSRSRAWSKPSCRPRSTGCGWRTAGRQPAGRRGAHGTVTAHLSADPRRNFIRILTGDRVRVRLSPRDLTRGAIVAQGRLEPQVR